MGFIRGIPGEEVFLTLQLIDGATNQYPQAKIYDKDSNLEDTVNLTHIADGNYGGTFTSSEDSALFVVNYIVYSDSGHTTPNTDYDYVEDKLLVKYEPWGAPGFIEELKLKDDDVKKIAVKLWGKNLFEDIWPEESAAHTLIRKSEFDPLAHPVRVDVLPEIPELRTLEVLLSRIDIVRNKIKDPPSHKLQLSAILKEVKAVNDKESLTEADLNPLMDKLNGLTGGINEVIKESGSKKKVFREVMLAVVKEVNAINDKIKGVNQNLDIFRDESKPLLDNLMKNVQIFVRQEADKLKAEIQATDKNKEILSQVTEAVEKIVREVNSASERSLTKGESIMDSIKSLNELVNANKFLINQLDEKNQRLLRRFFQDIEDQFFTLNRANKRFQEEIPLARITQE